MRSVSVFLLLAASLIPMSSQALPVAVPTAPASDASCKVMVAVPKAEKTFTVGTLQVQRYGDHGRAVILIPGLESGTWAWADTIRHLKGDHVVYALTLAGFDGVPAPKQSNHLLDQADASLLTLIKTHHIDHPVLVGHSIGGTLSIRFAGEHSDLLAGVVAVDGLPVFPGAQALTADKRKARAGMMKQRMTAMSPAQLKTQQVNYMKYVGVIDPVKATCYATQIAKSDLAATAEYMAEDYASDYRPGLAHVSVPLLEIVPFYEKSAKAMAARTGQPAGTAKDKAAFYAKLLANDAEAQVVTIAPSRHFVMLDQPQKFLHTLNAFLTQLPK